VQTTANKDMGISELIHKAVRIAHEIKT
jgi:hypothetical protein